MKDSWESEERNLSKHLPAASLFCTRIPLQDVTSVTHSDVPYGRPKGFYAEDMPSSAKAIRKVFGRDINSCKAFPLIDGYKTELEAAHAHSEFRNVDGLTCYDVLLGGGAV